jgi:hypothetical protein
MNMSPDFRRSGTNNDQIDEVVVDAVDVRVEPEFDASEEPHHHNEPVPPSSDPPAIKTAKAWYKSGAGIASALMVIVGLINVGVAISSRNDSYVTRDLLSAKLETLQVQIAEVKDIKATAKMANDRSAEAIDRIDKIEQKIVSIHDSIEGFNHTQAKKGLPTPLPLANYPYP